MTISPFKYLQGHFHSDAIIGLDVCIRKQLLVTCSKDKTVCIWNYEQRRLELCQAFNEECLAVAFHPSGFHVIVANTDKIQLCNVTSTAIIQYK